MRDGIYAVTLAQGSARVVMRVGWFHRQREDPDEYDVQWCTIYRNNYDTLPGDVWAKGPSVAKGWRFGVPVRSVAHRFHVVPLAILSHLEWQDIVGKEPSRI